MARKKTPVKKYLKSEYFVAPLTLTLIVLGVLTFSKRTNQTIITNSNNFPISPTTTISGTFNEKNRIFSSPPLLDFKTYQKYSFELSIPPDWEIVRNEFTSDDHILVIHKNGNKFTIAGPIIEGSICNYAVNGNVDALYKLEEQEGEIGEIYDQFVPVNSELGKLRIGRIDVSLHKDNNFVDFKVCHLEDSFSPPTWEIGTKIGTIDLRTAYNYDQKIVDEIKETISKLKYIVY